MEDCIAIGTFKIKNYEGNTPIHLALFNWKDLSIESLKVMLSKPKYMLTTKVNMEIH